MPKGWKESIGSREYRMGLVEMIREEAKDTAVKIRRRLKKDYPELPNNHFKVRTSVFAGGDSVTVSWENYPSRNEVDKILEEYQSTSFDGMQDMSTRHGYVDPEDGKRYSGAKYISSSYSMTDEWRNKVLQNKVNLHNYKEDVYVNDDDVREYLIKKISINKNIGSNWDGAVKRLQEDKYIEDVEVIKELKEIILEEHPKRGKWERERLEAMDYLDHLEEEYDIREENITHNTLESVLNKMDVDGNLVSEYNPKEYDGKKMLKDSEQIKEVLKESVRKVMYETPLNRYGFTVIEANMYGKLAQQNKYSLFTHIDGDFIKGVEKYVIENTSKEMALDIKRAAENAIHLEDFKKWVQSIWGVRETTIEGVLKLNEKYRQEIVDYYTRESRKAYDRLQGLSKKGNETVKILNEAYEFLTEGNGKFKYIIEKIDRNEVNFKKEIDKYIKNKEKEYTSRLEETNKIQEENEEDKVEHEKEEQRKNKGDGDGDKMGTTNVEIRKYKNKEELANDVMTELLKGEVFIEFIKADGTERKMRATRSVKELTGDGLGKLKAQVVEWNTETEIRKEIALGTINVVDLDKNAPRKFVLERLAFFKKGTRMISVVREEEEKDLSKYFDPTNIKTEKIIDILSKKVVRLVFKKRDGTSRPMVATRNSELVALYENVTEGVNKKPVKTEEESAESIQRQIERDYVSVFDLTVGEFRSFKPSTLERYDSDLSISSWMEFTVANDGWYDIARNGADPVQYHQEGKRGAKSIGRSLSEREEFEEGRKEYLEDMRLHRKMLEERKEYASTARREADIKKERRQKLRGVVDKEVKEYAEQAYTKKDLAIYKELVKVPDALSNDISFNNMENEITQVKNMDKHLLVALQVRQDVFYMHPTFIVNVYSGRVYMDNTEDQVFSDIGEVYDSDADWGSEDILEAVATKIGTGRKKKRSMFNQDEGTLIRVQRINTLAETHRMEFTGYGMNIGTRTSPDGSTELLGVSYKGKNYLIHPDVVIQVGEDKGKVLFKVERSTSRVREFTEFFNKWARSFQDERDKKVVTALGKMVLHGLDLRKTVKEVS